MAQISMDYSKMECVALRLRPHQDLKKELTAVAKRERWKAACIVTVVGSLEQINLRYANQEMGVVQKGHFEIVSLTGTFNESSSHFHLSVSDSLGHTIGGHLLDDNLVYTTAEIVVGKLTDLEFAREKDSTYGYSELSIKPHKKED